MAGNWPPNMGPVHGGDRLPWVAARGRPPRAMSGEEPSLRAKSPCGRRILDGPAARVQSALYHPVVCFPISRNSILVDFGNAKIGSSLAIGELDQVRF